MKQDKTLNFRLSLFLLVVILLLAGVYLFIFTKNIGLKYQLTDLKIRINELTSRTRQLAGSLAHEEDLGYVEKMAREKLGMTSPEKIIYLRLTAEAGAIK